jgi:tetratricopeptide (TPR) repeat protein/DNA-binding winged helix-turn-helix (wHTH) protein
VDSDLLQGFYLNNVLVEPLKGQVLREGEAVRLPSNAMEVLLALASRPTRLVTREALIEKVWGAGRGSPEALGRAISEIRHALGDHSDHPRFVQTLPRRGYRLIVEPAPAARVSEGDGNTYASEPGNGGFFDNLKDRGVVQAAVAYILSGWLIMQVADTFLGLLNLPAWSGTFVAILVVAGFPVVLVLAWFLEFREGRAVLDTGSHRDARQRQFSRTYLSVIAALAIAAVGVYVYDSQIGLPQVEEPPPTSAGPEAILPPVLENSIAVLPFLNLDGSEETRIFANGLVDDVINRLSRVPGLLVSSRGDAYTLTPNSASDRVRDRLRVARYLEGSVQMSGERMRIIVQLIDSETGFHLLSRSFDRLREDFFDIRDEITALTVANVRVALPSETQALTESVSEDPSLDVYVLYRRGLEAYLKPNSTDTLQEALGWFQVALSEDADYAAAHAGKCQAYVKLYPTTDDPRYIDLAETSCAQALQLNPNLDVVHTALGELYRATGKYDKAEDAYLAALEIDANSASSLIGLGLVYALQRRPTEAEERFRQAIGLHPGDWSAYNSLGYFLYSSGRYEEAARQYEHVVALDRDNFMGWGNLGASYMLAGDFESALSTYQRALEIQPLDYIYSNLGLMYYYLGRFEEAIEAQRTSVELAPNDYLAWSNLGDALWMGGQAEEARTAFQTAWELATAALEVNPNEPGVLMDLAWITAMLERPEAARELADRALATAPDDPYVHYFSGLVRLRADDEEGALTDFEAAIDGGYPPNLLARDPQLEPIWGDDRLRRILNPVGTR